MANLLLEDRTLIVLPKLARAIGLNEAIFIQQIYYLIKDREEEDRWFFASVEKLQAKHFSFWSEKTIRRIKKSLIKEGILLIEKKNKFKGDHTLAYSVDIEKLHEISDKNLINIKKDNPDLPTSTSNNTDTDKHPPADLGGDLPIESSNRTMSASQCSKTSPSVASKPGRGSFIPPKIEEIQEYARENGLEDHAEAFIDHYITIGWKVGGKAPMEVWKSAYRNWCRLDKKWKREREQKRSKMDRIQSKMW